MAPRVTPASIGRSSVDIWGASTGGCGRRRGWEGAEVMGGYVGGKKWRSGGAVEWGARSDGGGKVRRCYKVHVYECFLGSLQCLQC